YYGPRANVPIRPALQVYRPSARRLRASLLHRAKRLPGTTLECVLRSRQAAPRNDHPMPREDAQKGRRGRRGNGGDSALSTGSAGTPQAQSVQRLTSAYIQTLDPGANFCVTVSTLKWRETADG